MCGCAVKLGMWERVSHSSAEVLLLACRRSPSRVASEADAGRLSPHDAGEAKKQPMGVLSLGASIDPSGQVAPPADHGHCLVPAERGTRGERLLELVSAEGVL
jgi:hypothetical protein